MAKYLVEINRTQKASATVEVEAGSGHEAYQKALVVAPDAVFSTYETDYDAASNPVYIRPEGLVNKFSPHWEKLETIMSELGYTLEINDTEDEPAYYSQGIFVNDSRAIFVKIYLREDVTGVVEVRPEYPTYEFDHTDDPERLSLSVSLLPRTYKTRLTAFVSSFEMAHALACAAQKELDNATEKAAEAMAKINGELGASIYSAIKITARRQSGKIVFYVDASSVHNPEQHTRLAKILKEEGIVQAA